MSLKRRTAALSGLLALSLLATSLGAQPPPDPPPDDPAAPAEGAGGDAEARARQDARRHFERGLSLYDAGTWDAALAEFLLSRKLYPTRAATKNAALCLRRLGRFDEALVMLELLLAFPELTAEERRWTQAEIAAMRGLVGGLVVEAAEPGATVAVDGDTRGTTPLPAPLRVSAGSHMVRVYKPGFEPWETRVEVAGGQSISLRPQLTPLLQSGWLAVEEVAGKALEVVVDNAVMGRSPWRGLVAPGEHTVHLRGEGRLGTQPASVTVRLNQVTNLLLLAEELPATLRVEPTPAGASVVIDGVSVGRGYWEGALRPGIHRVQIAAQGFEPEVFEVALRADEPRTIRAALEPIAGPPLWWVQARFFLEADAFHGAFTGLGGDLVGACAEGCSAPLGAASLVMGRAGYRLPSGLLLAVEAGYLAGDQLVYGRSAAVRPTGLPENPGRAIDNLTLHGALVGLSPGLRLDGALPLTFGIGVGAFLGELEDAREGSFTPRSGQPYAAAVTEVLTVQGMYIAPEVRIRAQLGPRLEIGAGVRALFLILPSPPSWVPYDSPVQAASDGEGYFLARRLSSAVLAGAAPGMFARYEF